MQHVGDLIVSDNQETKGPVTGTTYVRSGGSLVAHGQLAGGLIVEAGGHAVVHGQVARNVVNHGTLELHGQVVGQLMGHPPVNQLRPNQVIGNDLEVPFLGTTTSWSSTR